MKIVFFGTPDFAVPTLKALKLSGHNLASVVTQPDRVKGRGHKLSMPPVKEYALSENIPVLQPSGIRSAEFFEEISALDPDMIVVVAYGRIIPPSIIHMPPMGCINVHASLLPKYRGAAPIQWAIVNGESKTGVTTMLMDEGLDTGDILLREETLIAPDDNSLTLGLRLSCMGADLLIKTIGSIVEGDIRPVPQIGESTYAPIIKKEDGRIVWTVSAAGIHNLIRGMHPWPAGQCMLSGERLSIISSRVVDEYKKDDPGRVTGISGNEIHVGTGMGILAIREIKPEGRNIMTGAAFANGRRLREGACFES